MSINGSTFEIDSDLIRQLNYRGEGYKATINNVGSVLDSCLSSYLASLPPKGYEASPSDGLSLYGYYINHSMYGARGYDLMNTICANIPTRINSDVGGIGIYVSYWIQTGLAIIGFIGTILWKWMIPSLCKAFFFLRYDWVEVQIRGRKVDRIVQKHLSRLITSLTDFHKSQCFFMLATNIAALVVLHKGGLDPQSLQQIYNSYIFLKVVAINGFLPITFTLTNLSLVNMLSWYLVIMSALTVTLSIATFGVVGKFNPSKEEMKFLRDISTSGGPSECDSIRPGVYCYAPIGDYYSSQAFSSYYGSWNIDSDGYSILGFCLVVMILHIGQKIHTHPLVFSRSTQTYVHKSCRRIWRFLQRFGRHNRVAVLIWQIRQAVRTLHGQIINTLTPSSKTSLLGRIELWSTIESDKLNNIKAYQSLTEHGATLDRYIRKYLQAIGRKGFAKLVLKTCIFVLFLSLYLKFFIMFLKDLAWFAWNDVYNNVWNFGQIVAITVWAPPIVDFFHLELRGVQRGFDHRLLPPFRVARTNTDIEHGPTAPSTESSDGIPRKTYDDNDDDEDDENNMQRESRMSSLDAYQTPGVRSKDWSKKDDHGSRLETFAPNMSDHNRRNNRDEAFGPLPSDSNDKVVAIIPLREEDREMNREWLLPSPQLPSRAITFSDVQI